MISTDANRQNNGYHAFNHATFQSVSMYDDQQQTGSSAYVSARMVDNNVHTCPDRMYSVRHNLLHVKILQRFVTSTKSKNLKRHCMSRIKTKEGNNKRSL